MNREQVNHPSLIETNMKNMTLSTTFGRCAVIAVLAFGALLTGCATSPYTNNEGSTRVARYTNKGKALTITANGLTEKAVGLYMSGLDLQTDASTIINRGDAFSVRLLSAFICDFRESSNFSDITAKSNNGATPCRGGDSNGGQHAGTRGEIAIVANVGERRDSVGGLTFDPSNVKNGRVIYYNEDVRETGQLINALNLPVYGPKTYDGKPFYMDWSVLELDNKENAAARKLLKQLADVGTLPAAPYTPVLKLLNTLGGALIDANGDDLEMRYQMETDPTLDCDNLNNPKNTKNPKIDRTCENLTVHRMPLREGYYAFVRSENRSEYPDLSGIEVCKELGVLCAGDSKQPWRDKTWLLVRVAREDNDAALAQDTAQNLAELMDSLNANNSLISNGTISGVPDAVKAVLEKAIKTRKTK